MSKLTITSSTNDKWRFKTRTLFYAISVVAMFMFAIGFLNRLQLWRDTIFHSDQNATLELPLGEIVEANQWITTSKSLSLTFLFTSNSKEFLLVQNSDTSTTATMIVDGERFEAIVTDYRFQAPRYRAEYWIRPGKKIGIGGENTQSRQNHPLQPSGGSAALTLRNITCRH